MQIFHELTYINNSSLVLGFFDAIHLGHKVVLNNAISVAKKLKTVSTVITFRNHPLSFLTGKNIEQILTISEKIKFLETLGIDNVFLLDFENYANIKAVDYLENILIKYFSPCSITTGFNHCFGLNKDGNSYFLKKFQNKYKYKYYEVPPFVIDGNIVSCSVIKKFLRFGDFFNANKLLGYNFFVKSIVINGDKIASKLGFPSANIIYPEYKIKIPFGVYFVKVKVKNKIYKGILNHGFAPTFDNDNKIKTEVHILDFNENIYGENIEIFFISKIRNQFKFENIEKLKAQIMRDIAFANIYNEFINEIYI